MATVQKLKNFREVAAVAAPSANNIRASYESINSNYSARRRSSGVDILDQVDTYKSRHDGNVKKLVLAKLTKKSSWFDKGVSACSKWKEKNRHY